MTKEDLLKKIEESYSPNWDGSPNIKDLISDINGLYALPSNSREYFELKSRVIGYLSMNCIEQLERGKLTSGILTRKMLENLLFDLSERETK